LDSHRHRD